MTAATNISYHEAEEQELAHYRAVCRSAVLSVALAAISLPLVVMAIYSGTMKYGDAVPLGFVGAVFAVLALGLGIAGLFTIRRYPEEYTGSRLAKTGLIGGLVLFVLGSSISAYTYATEKPPDAIRTGFWELQPD